MKKQAPRVSGRRPLDVDTLWKIQRIGTPALAPDGRHAVVSVTTPSMAENRSTSRLWLLPTERAAPRVLTRCGGKDGQAAWSPTGAHIAFIARREQQGAKDGTPQLYLIGANGGEARRVSDFAPGIESFKWLPDGRRIVFTSWVWPALKGALAQVKAHQAFGARKESGYVTSEAYYRYFDHEMPMDRVLHLLLLDLGSRRVIDLFEGTKLELPRDADGNTVYDVHPAGRRIAFAHDPGAVQVLGNRLVVSEIDLRTRRVTPRADDADWDFNAPRYSPEGNQLAVIAQHVGFKHTASAQLALIDEDGSWRAFGKEWDHSIDAPLRWSADGLALRFAAQERGRCHLWRYTVAADRFEVEHAGGWVQGFDAAGDTVVVSADCASHPVQLLSRRGADPAQRLEAFNDALLADVAFGEVHEVEVTGALNEPVQMWLTHPPGFDPKQKYALNQVIHGGPFAAAGDTFSYRWNVHVLASRGHVVTQLNYHGSSGFGSAFRDSLIGHQGALELQDIEAATDWLLAQRWCDPKRMVATGGSYGGFLVAWMNGHLPPWPEGRFRAYVCHAGVFDRVATFSADSYPERPKDLAANYWQDLPKVLSQSPATFAAQMATPTLVIHGARDYRVPDCNGLAYYNTLKARGVDARLLWFPDENHWVLKPRNSKLWYGEFADWLEAHAGVPKPKRAGGVRQGSAA